MCDPFPDPASNFGGKNAETREIAFFTFTHAVPASNTGQAFQRRPFMTNETHEINLDEALRNIGPDAAAIFENASTQPSEYASSDALYAAIDEDEEDEDEEEDYDDEDEDEDDEDPDDDDLEDDEDEDEDEDDEDLEYEDDDDDDEEEDEDEE
jgi:hypothetical protein